MEYYEFTKITPFFQIKDLTELEDAGGPGNDDAFLGECFPTCRTTLLYSFAKVKLPESTAEIGYIFVTPCIPFFKWFFVHLALNNKGNNFPPNFRGPLTTDAVLYR